MVRRKQVSPYSEEVVFSERIGEQEIVYKIDINKDGAPVKTKLFTYPKPLIAMQVSSKDQLSSMDTSNNFQYFFIMDVDFALHLIKTDTEIPGHVEFIQTHDYANFPLEKLIKHDWQ